MIISLEAASAILKELKKNGKKIVFTNGCFDILHAGHTEYLRNAKQLGDYLVLGLNTDNSVKRLKGESRPINNENDRAKVIDSLKSVDFVVMFDEDTPYNLIKEILPDFLVKGGDYKPEEIVGYDTVTQNGGKVVTISFVQGKSTTDIINKISNCTDKI